MPNNRTVHLVGSIPLPDSETVFRTVCQALGASIKRIPDGETGDRSRWIWFQRNMLENHPDMEIDASVEPFRLFQWDGKLLRETPWIKFKDSADPSTSSFPTGYRDAAVESYQVFARLQEEGVIGPDVRFQVSIPSPMATAYMYITPKAREAYLPAYERALAHAVSGILGAIPHDRLAIQWDVCQEVLLFEDYFEGRPAGYKQQIFDELARIGSLVPGKVELGYHLCYAQGHGDLVGDLQRHNVPVIAPPGFPAPARAQRPHGRRVFRAPPISERAREHRGDVGTDSLR